MSPQQTIAHYRILSKLGEGGMGAVYRATDTKLNRDVAIKVIPDSFALDPDRMARFAREAQVLASLNHPNIAAIYGVEERALVLELVDGPTLAERIAQGAIPLEEAVPIVQQIAGALEYAHERGIVHRDLKPANIKVTPEGRVKVLDFGLAKAFSNDTTAADTALSPTLTMRATVAGVIMGTAAYMSPEQAKGKPVDRRADIWAFGVVVLEMLTGRQLYTGETLSEILAAVIMKEPDLAGLPDATPSAIRNLLRRCLQKDPLRRLRDIGEARIALEEAPAAELPAPFEAVALQPRRGVPFWAVALLLVGTLVLAGFLWRATRPVERPMMRFSADLGQDAIGGGLVTAVISPDGTRLAFTVRGTGNTRVLATRLLNQSKVSVLAGTEGGINPFFSPDSKWIGFFADQTMKKISVQGGAAVTLCDTTAPARGASWGEDGNIIANLDSNHLFRVPAAGGKPQMLSSPDDRDRSDRWPQILPGGQMVMFTARQRRAASAGFEDASISVLSLKTGEVKVVHPGGYFGRYLPGGHLIYVHQGTLFAVPFDLSRLETRGMPVPVLDDVAGVASTGAGQLDFSQTGTLIYLSGTSTGAGWRIVWMDSTGKTEPLVTTPIAALTPRLSPDGKRLAAGMGGDIAIYDSQRDSTTRLTHNTFSNRNPLWTPDGKHLIFSQESVDFGIWWIRTDGSGQPEKLLSTNTISFPSSLSPDGRRVAFNRQNPTSGHDIWILPLDLKDSDHPKPGQPEPLLQEPGDQADAAFSPDGRWIAYSSSQSGTAQVFIQPFPSGPASGKWLVSNSAARFPVWSRNARELFYLNSNNQIMVASYTVNGEVFNADKPRPWSLTPITRTGPLRSFDLAPDGKRFLVFPTTNEGQGDAQASVHMTVLLNFFDELRRQVPPGGK